MAFWQDLSFKAAAVLVASVFLLGDATGHIHQMLGAGNFSTGNAGVPFYTDILCPILATSLLFLEHQRRSSSKAELSGRP